MSSYKDNQKSEHVQRKDEQFRYVTGLWKKENGCLKSGRINMAGWENLQAFGEKTIFIINENKQRKKKPGGPDFSLYTVEDYAK